MKIVALLPSFLSFRVGGAVTVVACVKCDDEVITLYRRSSDHSIVLLSAEVRLVSRDAIVKLTGDLFFLICCTSSTMQMHHDADGRRWRCASPSRRWGQFGQTKNIDRKSCEIEDRLGDAVAILEGARRSWLFVVLLLITTVDRARRSSFLDLRSGWSSCGSLRSLLLLCLFLLLSKTEHHHGMYRLIWWKKIEARLGALKLRQGPSFQAELVLFSVRRDQQKAQQLPCSEFLHSHLLDL